MHDQNTGKRRWEHTTLRHRQAEGLREGYWQMEAKLNCRDRRKLSDGSKNKK